MNSLRPPRNILSVLIMGLLLSAVVLHADQAPLQFSVSCGGRRLLPAHGTAAGVWFYVDRESGTQLLLLGHREVPEGWRMAGVLREGVRVRIELNRQGGSPAGLDVEVEGDWLLESGPGVLILEGRNDFASGRIRRFKSGEGLVNLEPVRRPFSLGPVESSPSLDPVVFEALVEWDWRMQDGIGTPREARTYAEAVARLLPRIDRLVDAAIEDGGMSASVLRDAWSAMRQATEEGVVDEGVWLRLHRFRRELLIGRLPFDIPELLFVKHVPSVMSHQLTQLYGYCARPGGGLFSLRQPGRETRVRELTPEGLPAGSFLTPELSHDAERLYFAYCPVVVAPASWDFDDRTAHLRYHLYEMSLQTGAIRQLTSGDTDNFSPVIAPDGGILYCSTQRGGYHRCGRGPCFVYTLSRMEPGGEHPRVISFHETHEWDPSILNDGRVIYTRWDYVDRNAVLYQQLWVSHPDGGNARIFFGNNTWNPTGIWEARAIPGSNRVMATAGPHHGMSAGSIILVDPSVGVDGNAPLRRLTPDVRFPESEAPLAFGPTALGYDYDTPVTQYWQSPMLEPWRVTKPTEEELRWPGSCYKSPWPLTEELFLVSYSFDRLVGEPGPNIPNMFGIYFADAHGNKELIYRDPAISSLWARPLRVRSRPPAVVTAKDVGMGDEGTFFVSDVAESWPRLPEDRPIEALRIIEVLIKTTPHADQPRVGAAMAAPGKQVLGTVPVEADGSAFFRAPAGVPMLFQALDRRGRAVQSMRSLVYLQPGEQASCIGCHEDRMEQRGPSPDALALRREPSRIEPGPEGSKPFSFVRLVQPVLDRHCVGCHDGQEAARPDLRGLPEGGFTRSYQALVERVSYSAWGLPMDNGEPLTEPLRFGALGSPLLQHLLDHHAEQSRGLTDADWARLHTWMDCNALFYGTFDPEGQRRQLAGEVIAEVGGRMR